MPRYKDDYVQDGMPILYGNSSTLDIMEETISELYNNGNYPKWNTKEKTGKKLINNQ